MKHKWSALVFSLLLCPADKAGALIVYTESTETQFTAGSHNSTYVTGSGASVALGLDHYGRAAGLSAPDSAEWFNTGWKYRQPLSLNSANPATLANYPVLLTLNTQDTIAAGRMNADGSDIRFTTAAVSGSASSLSYYIESGINSASTKIWVKLPSAPSGASSLYLYSGSTSAAAVSSIADTFTMGNNFNAGNGSAPSAATWSNIESAAPQAGSVRDIQFNRLRLLFGSPLNTRHYGLRSGSQYSFTAGRHYRVELNARATGSDSWSSVTLCQTIYNYSYDQDDWLRFSIRHSAGGPTYTLERSDYGSKTTLASGSVSDGFHGIDILVSASSFTVLLDGSQIYGAVNNLTFNSPYIYLEAASASSSLEEFLFDNVFVHPYSKPEPAYVSPGAGQGRRYPSGAFTSQVKDSSAAGTNYKAADWEALTPSGSSVTVEMRANDTNIALSTFTAAAKGGDPLVAGRYVQYRLNLATTDPRYTASVSSLTLTYGSPPLAPGSPAGTTLSDSSIKWSWTDTSSGQFQEDGFQVLDATGAQKGSLATGATYWIETSLNPNTLYTRQILGYNAAGSGASTATYKYTLAAAPNVGCDKSTGTWLSGTLSCTNLAGFGNNGVAYYRYVWTQTPDRAAWTGTETQWTSGQLLNTAASSGFYYLHVKSYNGEDVPLSGYQTYGPYWYDKTAPSVTGFSPSSSPWVNSGLFSSVSLSDTGDSKLYRVRYRWTTSSDKPGSGWQAWDYAVSGNDSASSTFTIGSAGQWYLHVEVEDTAGNTGYAYSGIYKIDLTNPTGSITINNGDAYTPRKEVTLSLTYADSESGVKNLAYKNLGGSFSVPELPQATTAWALSPGDGSKQVYVQVTDNSGRTQQYTDTITLDSRTSLLGSAVNAAASGVMGEPAETFTARAVLGWTPTGENLAGKTLSFYFNGSTRTALTDVLGAATTNFYVLAATGTYVYSVSFSTDGVYSASSSTGTLAAALRASSVITEDANTSSGADFIAKATLKDFATETLIIGSSVTFFFEGSSKTAVTNGIGVATVTFTAPIPVNFYPYKATYEGGPVYAAKSAGSLVGVGLRITSLVVPGLTVLAQEIFTAQATLLDGTLPVAGSTVTFVFQGSTQTAVTDASGIALSTFTAPSSSGTYVCAASFPGDGTYAASSRNANMVVNRRPLSLAGDVLQGFVNATFQARAVLSDGTNAQKVAGKAIVFVFESSSATVLTDSNGVSTTVFNSGSLPRASTCYYYFPGDTGYAFADSTGAVSIDRRPVSLGASDAAALLGSSFTAIAELKDTAFTPAALPGKTITFSFLGSTQTAVTNSLGVASVTYQTGASTGSYEFYASFDQDNAYLAGNGTGTVTMDKRPTIVSAYPKFIFTFDSMQGVADLKDGITGGYISSQTITFIYNGVLQSTVTGASGGVAGRAYSVYPGTGAAGTYSYYAEFAGNALYYAKGSTAAITVSQRPVNLSAFPQTAVWGSSFAATAEFRDSSTNAPVNNKTLKLVFQSSTVYSQSAGAGSASANFNSPASTGVFNWLAQFDGDQAYSFASSSGTITVNRRGPTITAMTATKYIWESVFFSATFFDDGVPVASKQLSYFFQGSTLTATTNGSGLATAGPFASLSAAGVYGYTVQFGGDANYSAQSANSTLVVSSRPSNISIGPLSVIAASSFTLSATLLDSLSVTGISGKTVSFTLQGATYAVSAVTNGSGVAAAAYFSSSTTGPYTYSATFSGNSNYAGTSSSDTVTVMLRPSVLEMADFYPAAGSTFTASAVLKDFTTGVTLSTRTVSFLFLASTRTASSNSVGYSSASYFALASTASYPLSASWTGDTLYAAASISKTVFPGRRNTAIQTSDILNAVAKDSVTVTARLSDYDLGTFLSGSTITFSFTGSTYTLTAFTNSTGSADVLFTAPASTGSYTYSASFAGTEYYNGITNTSVVLVDRRTITLEPGDLTSIPAGSTFTASALMKDGAITLSTKTLSFVFFSTRTAVTNGIGVASTTFLAPLSTGTFAYTVSYPGDALYKPGSGSGSVGVVLKPTVLEVLDVNDAVVGLSFTGTAKLRDIEMGNALVTATKTITFIFTSSTINSVTDVGVATASLTAPLVVGTYTYTASFAGDGTYGASQSTGTVTVKRRPVIFSVDIPAGEPYTLSTFTVKGTLIDGKTGEALANQSINIYFSVANATHTLQTDAVGIATTAFYAGLSSGNYVYSGAFNGDASYNASEVNEQTVKTININPRPTSIQPYQGDGQLLTESIYTFSNFNTTVVMQDNLDGNSGIPGLTVNFIVQGSTITGVSATNGQATSGSAFPFIANAGIYPATVRFDGNQTYAPSVLPGGTASQIPLQGYVSVYQSPANIEMNAIQETFPDQDTVISGILHGGYLGDRPQARPLLKGLQVRYRVSDTPCNPYPSNCPWGTLGTAAWATVNDSYIATATVRSPTEIGDYPIERWFATTSSFYYWEVTETKRVLRVGLRPTGIDVATADPLEVGAQMPITVKVKLKSTSQSDIGIVGKTVTITFNSGTPQNVTTVSGGIAQYTFTGMLVGTYTYTATFAGDATYNSASLSPVGNVTVVKNTTFLVGTPVTNVPAGNNFIAKATLNVLAGTAQEPAAGREINFGFIGNADATAVTNALGIATVTFTSPQVPGNYDFTATLTMNDNDLGAAIADPTDNIQVVKRRTSLVSVAVNPVYIQDNFTSTATLTDLDAPPIFASLIGQTINFTLHRGGSEGDTSGNGTTIASPLGQATGVFLSPAAFGSRSYTASFAGTVLYAAVTAADVGVNVLKRTTSLSAAAEPTTPTNTVFMATVTLRDNTPTLGAPVLMGAGLNVPVKFVYDGVTRYGITNDFGIATATFTAQAAANDYICDITYEGSAVYAAYTLALPVHVVKRTTNVTGTAILNQPAGAQFTAQATLTDILSGSGINSAPISFVFIGGGTFNDSGTTNVSGVSTVTFTAPSSTGTYNYTACYTGDNTYAGSCDNANSVTVDIASTTLALPDGAATVNSIYFATATLKGKESGVGVANKTVSFTYRGASQGSPLTDAFGIAIQSFTPNATGVYQLDAAFAGDAAFYASAASGTITVNRRLSGAAMPEANAEVGALFIATVTLRDLSVTPSAWIAGSTVNFSFEGTPKSAVTNSVGVATVSYTAPSPGGTAYQLTASFAGDPIYGSTNAVALVNVSKRITSITVSSGSVTALEVFNASATLKWGLNPVPGKIIQFTYKGSVLPSALTDANGQAFLQFNAGASSGPWQVDGAFTDTGDPNYSTTSGTSTITVLRRNCVVIPDNISMSVYDTFNATVTFRDVSSSSTPAGKYPKVALAWVVPSTDTASATDSNGKSYRTGLTAPSVSGIYMVEAWYPGDSTYASSPASTATVTVQKRSTQLSVDDAAIMIGRVFTATATLRNDAVLLNDKDMVFTFEGKNFTARTGAGGLPGVAVATFTVTVSTGPSQINAVFYEDPSYFTSNTATATVTASMRPTTLTPAPATAIASKIFTATATLIDIDGFNVAARTVSFYFNGSTVTGNTNSLGVATAAFTASVSTGAYTVAVSFAGDYKYISSTAALSLTVNRLPTNLTSNGDITSPALDVFTDTVTLKDMDGQTLDSKTLRFVFAGSTFTKDTAGGGIAASTFTAPSAAGVYQVNVYFDGDPTYSSSTVAITLTAQQRLAAITLNPLSATALDIFRATATLTDPNNAAFKVSTRPVTFTFSAWGSTSAVTDGVGLATVSYQATDTAGTYTLTGTFAGDSTYASTTTSVAFPVAKRGGFVTGVFVSTRVFDVFTASATFQDSASSAPVADRTVKFSLQNVSAQSAVTNGSGIAAVNFTAPAASGTYTISIWSDGTSDLTYSTTTVYVSSVTLSRRNSSINLTGPATSIIGSSFTPTATLADSLPGGNLQSKLVSFFFQDSTNTATTDAFWSAGTVYTANLSSGPYKLQASFAGDASYNPSFSSSTVTMLRYPTQITAPPITVIMNEVLTATATLTDYKGSIVPPAALVFYFQSSSFTATTAAGVAYSTYSAAIASGTYLMPVSFAGDALYDSTGTTISVLVNKRTAAFTPVPVTAKALDIFTAATTLADLRDSSQKVQGEIVTFGFLVAGSTFPNSGLTNGSGIVTSTFTAPVSSGTYQILTFFAGNATYYPLLVYSTVTIVSRPTLLMQDNSIAAIDEIFRTTATLVDQATLQAIASRTVAFTFGSSSSGVTGADGKASVTFSALSSYGAFQLNSDFAGDATYAASSSTGVLTIVRRPVLMSAPDIPGTIDEIFTATVTVSDGLSGIMVATRTISFVFGSTFTAVTGVNGVAVSTFSAPVSSGVYYAAINFAGDSMYLPAGTTVQLAVNRRPSGIDLKEVGTMVGQVFTATATLRDTLNPTVALAGRELVFLFSGSSFTAVTNAAGLAVSTFMAPSSSGTVRLDISFGGDARYSPSASTAAVVVLRRPSGITIDPATIRAMDVLTSTATLTDATDPGVFVNGRGITFTFSGENFTSVTDAGGIAVSTFAGPSSTGTYLVEASFAGDAVYDAAYASGTIAVTQRPAGITIADSSAYPFEDFLASVYLKDAATDGPVAGRALLFGLNGTSTGAVTSGVGLATATYTPPGAFGNYKLSADFAGDATYAAAGSTATVSVMQRPTALTAQDAAAVALDSFTVYATLSDIRFSTAVAGKEVVFSFKGQQSTAAADADGLASAQFTAPVSSGVYFFKADFTGDAVYAVSFTTGEVTVATRETRVVARDTNANVGEPFILEAQLLDPAREELSGYFVPNSQVEFKFKDRNGVVIDTRYGITNGLGKATAAFSGPGAPDVYYYTARFAGDFTYSPSSATAMVKVGLLTSLVAFDVETVALEGFTVKGKLTDYLASTLDDKTVRFTFLGSSKSGMTNADGKSGIAVSSFTAPAAAGTYYYNAYFDGDAIYSASNATATIAVSLRPSAILTYPAATLAYSSFTAVVLLKNTLSPYANIGGRDVDIVFNGSTITATTDATAGTASAVFFAPVSSGTFNFTAYFNGDDTYDTSSAVGSLSVTLRPTNMISDNVTDLTANSTFTAKVQIKDNNNQPIPGLSVDFDFGGVSGVAVTDAQGVAETVYTAPASSGVYTYTAVFYGDPQYAPSSASGSVTVGPRPTMIFTAATSAKLGSPLELAARLVDVKNQAGIQGQTLYFYFNGSTLTALTDSYGASTVTFASPVSTGSYFFEAALNGDGITYIGSYSSAAVTIALNLTKLEAKDGILLKIYEPLNVEATLKDSLGLQLPGLPITFTFEGQTFSGVTNEVGKATSAFSTMSLPSTGTYNYSADYPGDTLFVASSDTSNVVTVYRRDSLLIARDAQNPPNKAFIAEARLYDNVNGSAFMGAPVSGKAVIFELYDSTYTQTSAAFTSAQGASTVTFVSPVSTGTYLLTARFAGSDPVYEGYLSTATLTVLLGDESGALKTKMRVDSVTTYINQVFTASGTLTASDIPVNGVPVLFEFFNGIATYTAAGLTNGAGLAVSTFMAPASSGTYIITAAFPGDAVYSAATGTSTVSAARYPDSLTASDVAVYTGEDFRAKAVFRDELTLAYVPDKTVTFEFYDGVSTMTKTAVTSSTGSTEATFTAPSVPGSYSFTASFAGDALYAPTASEGSVLLASRGSSTFLVGYDVFIGTGEVVAASTTLTYFASGKQLPVPGKAVTISFQGLSRVSTTNAQGLAFSTFTAPSSSGTFVYQAEFIGDAGYNATLATAAVSVVFRKVVEQPVYRVEVTSAAVIFTLPVSTTAASFTIEESASLRGVTRSSASVAASTSTAVFTLPVDPDAATFFKVKTKLADEQESQTVKIIEIPSRTEDPARVPNYYYMSPGANPQEWAAWVRIPGKVMDKVGTADFSLEVKKETNPAFLAAYTVTPSKASAELASDLKASNKNGVRLTIAYPQGGAVTSAASGQLAIYWFNGVEWVKLGGEIDVLTGELYTYSRVLGQFAIKAAPLASVFTLTKVAPRIFSPDEPDPAVNRARFYFENPALGEVTIRIFDITGTLVRRNLESEGSNIMFWNGKDQSGALVRGGVYIYQIESSDKVLTGTVVVAK